MRLGRLFQLIAAIALLAILALPGSAFASPTAPHAPAAAAVQSFPLKPSAAFSTASGTLTVTSTRAAVTVSNTGLRPGTVVCLTENARPITCTLVSAATAATTFAHLPLAAISLAPGTTYAVTVGAIVAPIVSVTLH
jgi:hypothetical protein